MKDNRQSILCINTRFEGIKYPGLVCESFGSSISFLDYDAVIIDSCCLSNEYENDTNTYNGKRLISMDDSQNILNDFSRIKEQITEMLYHEKNVFVIISYSEDCYIYTGKSSYAGTGKNARKTNYVDLLNVFSFLPVDISPKLIKGTKTHIACNTTFLSFFNSIKQFISYDAYFSVPHESQLVLLPNKTNTVSAVFKIGKGNLVLLPSCGMNCSYESRWKNNAKIFLNALLELNHALLNEKEKYVLPLWTDSIKIPGESLAEKELENYKSELVSIEEKITKQKDRLNKIIELKKLITASGTNLEEIVKHILTEMGFSLSTTEIGRSDVVATYQDYNVVAEIKGVTKSAAEKHAAQLEKWVSQFIDENGRVPKAILFVNGFCDTPLSERKEEVFPDQMMEYCNRREHALITTTQLLCMYIDIKNNPSSANERITELLSCVGKFQRYLDYENYLEIKCDAEEKAE